MDEIIDTARMTIDSEERIKIYREINDILKEDVPLIPIYTTKVFMFFSSSLKNVYPHPVYRFNVSKMYFE